MRRFTVILCLAATLLAGGAARAQAERIVVLTAHPAAQAIVATLAAGTDIEARPIQPAKLPAARLASFLGGRGAAGLREAAAAADAVVTFRSFWPDDPLYPHARRANIRIVEIDAGRPLDGALPGIAVLSPADDREAYKALGLSPMPAIGEAAAPWLSPTALGRMLDVVAADLGRLSRPSKDRIATNLAEAKRRLIGAKAEADQKLAAATSVTAIALSGRYGYLANDLGLDLVASITAAPQEWTDERLAKLAAFIRAKEAKLVLVDAEPDATLVKAIGDGGARAVVMRLIEADAADVVGLVQSNAVGLAAALAPGP